MSLHATGRSMVAGTGIAAMLVAVPTAASSLPAISSIEKHWRDRCIAYREFEADPVALDDTERANDYWDRIDAAEVAILNNPDTSTRAAELRLWVAWSHCDETNRTAVSQADVPALRGIHASLDWHEKLIFAAILNLRGEG
ncbi:hypothetical protein [Sphingomonas adhaesiva]|uniref:hypothetical protein n=1 Tax=Sphingomonas adhaesiva TaxID=28212 RepID=UPI002FF98119